MSILFFGDGHADRQHQLQFIRPMILFAADSTIVESFSGADYCNLHRGDACCAGIRPAARSGTNNTTVIGNNVMKSAMALP
jgi:hypothetical protein